MQENIQVHTQVLDQPVLQELIAVPEQAHVLIAQMDTYNYF